MVFGLFSKKDPICGMKQTKEKGTEKYGKWFCSQNCIKAYDKRTKEGAKSCCS